jgi:hypothetical protein
MSIDTQFSNMLNEYLSYDLLRNEYMKRDWMLSNVEKDDEWTGGTMPVPFKESSANSINFGSLEDESDIGQSVVVRGSISGYKHVSGSMIFNHRDLMEHNGSKISKKSFLKLLPGEIEDHIKVLREVVSLNLLNGKKLVRLTANATNTGIITVGRPERLKVSMKLEIHDSVSTTPVVGYVKSIDIAAKTAVLVTTRGGSTPVDLSAWLLANAPFLCLPGQNAAPFSSLKEMLLSAANGGVASLYGQTKASFTYLQSNNVDGYAISATSILGKIYDAYTDTRRFYSGDPSKVLMSFKNFGTAMKEVQASKGAFNVVAGSHKASLYFQEATIYGIAGGVLDLVALQELDDDIIIGCDMSALKFHSNGFIRRVKTPDGLEYYTKRTTTGYKFILDHEIYGELVLNAPQKCFIIFGISY